jgi:hypothetical protein
MMAIEEQLRERLRKVEALFLGGATVGERDAAGAAIERLKAKLAETSRLDPPIEMHIRLPDTWSVRLFIALCRRHGLRPYRYPRQRYTTVMIRASKHIFDDVVWRQFTQLHADLRAYLEETTTRLIREAVHSDTADAETVVEPMALR